MLVSLHYSYCLVCGHEVAPRVALHPKAKLTTADEFEHYDLRESRICRCECEEKLLILHSRVRLSETEVLTNGRKVPSSINADAVPSISRTNLENKFSAVIHIALASALVGLVVSAIRTNFSRVRHFVEFLRALAQAEARAVLVVAYHAFAERVLIAGAIVSPGANRGGAGGGGAWSKGIAIVVLVFLVAYTAPAALQAMFTANTSGFSASGQGLWTVLPLIAEIALLVVIIRSAL